MNQLYEAIVCVVDNKVKYIDYKTLPLPAHKVTETVANFTNCGLPDGQYLVKFTR